ncbi:PAS domain S-box protein [Desulfosporosinus sp. Sb-LF]|uniref:SpoIIE family protein phosphatase n=1 Tax=Desulfosporosinus sp. Sb-LF TaxID=2560027 RepID=UPI00107FA673|nr:PAS domain S-box protein [Desulfosporosinus sp. Sb-LF]TGE33691.1 PAS domain S-box protein [Desulfosporosinus sp. Sb-LF]
MIIEKNDHTIQYNQYRDSFDLLFNKIEDYLFILDETGRIIRANKAALEKLEYTLEEIISLNIKMIHPSVRREELLEMVTGMLVGDISKCSIPLCTKSGRHIPVETRVFRGKWEGTDVLYGISKDVSAVKKAEDQLAKALRCKLSMTALSRVDTGEYVDINDVLVQTLGYEREYMLGKSAKDLNIFLDPKFRDNVITKVIEHGCVINSEVRIRDKTGNIYNKLLLAEIIEISNNKYLLTATSDITERRKQERMEQDLKNIQLIIESMPFLIWFKDKNGKYIIVNRVFEDFYKISNTEIVGKTDFNIFPYKIALEHKKIEEELITSKKRLLNPLNSNEVGGKWLETFVAPFFRDDGEVAGTLGVANNITVRKQLEMELANQKRFLKTMLDTIPDYIFYKDMNSAFLGCNKANAENVLGVNEDEVIGKTDLDLIKDIELAKFYRQKDQEAFLAGITLKNEEKIVLTNGSVIDAETIKTPFLDEQGNVAGLIGVSRDITERKWLEKQLREQMEYAELLFRTVPNAVLSVAKDGKINSWNKIAEEITGYAAAEVVGKECSMVLHGLCRDSCGLCGNAIDSPLINEKCNVVTKDGQIRHVLKSIAVVKDEFSEIVEKMECFEDITEMTNMEIELRQSNERYAAIVNNAPQIVVIHNKGIVKFVNDAGVKVLGYKEDECIGRHIKGFMTEDSFIIVSSALLDRAKETTGIPYEIELIKKSGEIINVLLKGTDIIFAREEATLAVMMDITESKQLNAKLRASEEKFRQFAETVNEIFLITDKERIVYVSPAYERIIGMTCQSLLDNPHSLVELIHTADRKRMRDSFPQSFRNMNEATNEEFRISRSDGETRWLWLQSYPAQGEDNNSPLKATSIVDITDRKRVEDKLRERERQTQMELLLAARVQQDSLPHPFAGAKVSVNSIFVPHSTVSGDFFNYKWFEEQKKLCGYIIDVCGHGVATAMQTATFKMMLDNVLLTGEVIKEGDIQTINQRIMQYLYEDSFVALLYFEFDLLAGVLKLICAGITLFLAAKPDECTLVPLSGCYLGIVNVPEIETYIIPVKAGEIYCMMSDGVSDLIELNGISKQEGLTGYMRWFEELAKCPERNDDFSAVCIEIRQDLEEINVLDIKGEVELERAQVIISEFLERNSPIHAPMLEVAVNEAMNNSFGSCGRVRVKTRRIGSRLIIRVKDDGPGFNAGEVTAKRVASNYVSEFDGLLEAEGGRGIFLMRSFCDKVIYNAKGNEVLLMKII